MPQQQLIIASKPVRTPLLDFLNNSQAIPIEAHHAPSEPEIFVHCDLCAETARATPAQLDRQGWGLYGDFSFCIKHEAMV